MTGPSGPKRGSSGTAPSQGVPIKLSDPLALAEIVEIHCSAREEKISGGK
jgi:hypothetical protein